MNHPTNVEAISHQLLVRAGFIRQLGQGLFSYLPLAKRSLTKIENILRDEMNAIGGQEMTMPVAHPAEVWQATGRWYSIGPEMARFKDRKERDMVLAMTHEEVVTDLCKTEIRSYRQLPQLVYHIQTKFRDDPRPRAGLIRVREFTMKDSYSLDADEAGLDKQYRAHYQAYFNIFNRCDLPAIAVGSDVGMMGGSLAHEYMYLTPIGEDTLVLVPPLRLRGQSADCEVCQVDSGGGRVEADREGGDARLQIDRGAGESAEHSQEQDGQGRVHDRRTRRRRRHARRVHLRRGARRYGSERDETGERRQSRLAAPRDRG